MFAFGVVMPDGTFNGGTGWAVELAEHWHEPVWVLVDAPRITRARFTGTGTRFLTDTGATPSAGCSSGRSGRRASS